MSRSITVESVESSAVKINGRVSELVNPPFSVDTCGVPLGRATRDESRLNLSVRHSLSASMANTMRTSRAKYEKNSRSQVVEEHHAEDTRSHESVLRSDRKALLACPVQRAVGYLSLSSS